jgi:hypothetical protein
MRFHLLLAATLVVLCGTVGSAIAAGAPMADAGLDQTVTDGTPVELDGSGSLHPDGQITAYEWSIEADGQGTFEPDCSNCERTAFAPPARGTYRVTLTVTDATGRSATDSMSLTVTKAGPSVELTNASQIQTDHPVTLVSEIESRDAELDRIGWALDGTLLAERSLSGATDRSELRMTFDSEKAYRIQVVAIDTDGRSTYRERVVQTTDTDESNTDREPRLASLPQPQFGTKTDRNGSLTTPDTGIDNRGYRSVPGGSPRQTSRTNRHASNGSVGFSKYGIQRPDRLPDADRSGHDSSIPSDVTLHSDREHSRAVWANRESFRSGSRPITDGWLTAVETGTALVKSGAESDTEAASSSEAADPSKGYTSAAASMLRERPPNATRDES